jgi:hypothetical protein
MKKANWIVYRTVLGIIQLLVAIYVLAAITDHNTRLIVAVLGLIYTTLAGGLLYLAAMQSAAMLEHEFRFHELLADANTPLPDRTTQLTIMQTNWVTQIFLSLVGLICLLTVFGSLQ